MTAQYRSVTGEVLYWFGIFVALGIISFVLGCGAGMGFEDAGLSRNRLAQFLVFGLMWPPYLLMRALGLVQLLWCLNSSQFQFARTPL